MAKNRIRRALLVGKVVLAAALMVWVLVKVHWADYAVVRAGLDEAGEAYTVVGADSVRGAPRVLTVRRASLLRRGHVATRPVEDFEPIGADHGGGVIRPGLASSLAGLNGLAVVAAVAAVALTLVLLAVRWRLLLAVLDLRVSVWQAVRLTFLGTFFNAIVPGTVGGDLVKAYYAAKGTGRGAAVLLSIFVDRVVGLAALAGMAAVMIVVVWAAGAVEFREIRPAAVTAGVALAIVAAAAALLFSSRLRGILHLRGLYGRLPIARHVSAVGESARAYRRQAGKLSIAAGLTFCGQVTWISSILLLGLALGLPIASYYYYAYVPLIYIIGAVPITPGGVGLIERLYLAFFAAANPSTVMALALLARACPIVASLPGALVALSGPKFPDAHVVEAELGLEGEGA